MGPGVVSEGLTELCDQCEWCGGVHVAKVQCERAADRRQRIEHGCQATSVEGEGGIRDAGGGCGERKGPPKAVAGHSDPAGAGLAGEPSLS